MRAAKWLIAALDSIEPSVGGIVVMASDAPPDRHSKLQGLSVSPSVDKPTYADTEYSRL